MLAVCITVVVVVLSLRYPILLKYLIGQTATLNKVATAKVYIDNQLRSDMEIYCRKSQQINSGKMLYLVCIPKNGDIIIVDLQHRQVGELMNSDSGNFFRIFDILLQSKEGSVYVKYDDLAKRSFPIDPALTVIDQVISFKTAVLEKQYQWKILL